MAAAVDSSLIKDPSPWLQRSHAVLDEMICRGNMVARMIKSELQQLEDILNRLPPSGEDQTARVSRSSGLRGSLAQDERQSRPTGPQLPLPALPPPPYMPPSEPMSDDFSMDELNWQDGLSAEQLVNFAESMDLSALDWLSVETEQ